METAHEARTDEELVKHQVLDLLTIHDPLEFAEASQAFIADRAGHLEQNSPPRMTISPMTIPHQGFIRPDTEVKSWSSGRAFHMDDRQIYTDLLSTMREYYKHPTWQELERYRQLVFYSVQYAVGHYFNGVFSDEEAGSRRRQKLVNTDVFSEHDGASIVDFKESALCTERAAAANNMLGFLGIPTEFLFADLQIDDRSDAHAFLVTPNAKGAKNIYDPTHPQVVVEKGTMTGINPFIIPNAETLFSGNQVMATHVNTVIADDGSNEQVTSDYTYTPGPNIYALGR